MFAVFEAEGVSCGFDFVFCLGGVNFAGENSIRIYDLPYLVLSRQRNSKLYA